MTIPGRPDSRDPAAVSAWRQSFAEDLHEELYEIITEDAPDDWVQISFRARTLIGNYGYDATAVLNDGSRREFDPSLEALEMLGDLRPRMNMAPFGVWFSVHYTVRSDDRWQLVFDYDDAPFDPALAAEAYADDFDFFPRDIEFVPDWLRTQLSAARTPPDWFVQPRPDGSRLPRRKVDRPTRIRPGTNLIGHQDLTAPERVPLNPPPAAPPALPAIAIKGEEFDKTTVDQLVAVGERLRRAAPNGWSKIRYSFSEIDTSISRKFQWISGAGEATDYEPNKSLLSFATQEEGRRAIAAKKCPPRPLTNWREPEIFTVFTALRTRMYVPGTGTWFTAVYTLDNSGDVTLEFNYDGEPDFFPRLVNGIYFLDQQRYPRAWAHTPKWLQHKIDRAQEDSLWFS
ncbi:hypothetical protein ACFVAV_04525 [Nocardia sp. NPDC057663]|uniref:hypothetical protein n=1 Tax=Nocardia sp. NPDC057663 TaxID=3346201 RepID=UPI00366A8262